jgi:hypothetical protein
MISCSTYKIAVVDYLVRQIHKNKKREAAIDPRSINSFRTIVSHIYRRNGLADTKGANLALILLKGDRKEIYG